MSIQAHQTLPINPKRRSRLASVSGSPAPAWETVSKIQGDLLKEQGVLIDQLTRERDEAINNLKTASTQWEQWRKESVQENDKQLTDRRDEL